MILNILKAAIPAELTILRQVSEDVSVFDRDLFDLTQNMIETLLATNNGVGLAAPQIGVNKNIFVMRTWDSIQNDTKEIRVIINPFVNLESGDVYKENEGCLSIPGLLGRVSRFSELGVTYADAEGKQKSEVITNLEARIFQHEHDHLLGVLFIDKADKFFRPKSNH